MFESIAGIVQGLRSLCFPASCLLCHTPLPASQALRICPTCLPQLCFCSRPLCPCCGLEFPDSAQGDHFCGRCLVGGQALDRVRSVLHYNDQVAKLVHSFKYAGKTFCHSTFAAMKARSLPVQDLAEAELILPVPLHKSRLRERGFNQALVLAELFFPEHKKRIATTLLVRSQKTTPQTCLSGNERRKNLKKAFTISRPELVKDRSVILIDDVFTTGTTLNECAKTLKKHGARSVQALTLARVVG